MSSSRPDEVRDYGFADQALALRQQAGLTQAELAALLDVSPRTIQSWEEAVSYPGAERLKQLIAFYLGRGTLQAGREEEEAAALWASVRGAAPRRTVPFDPSWFTAQRAAAGSVAPAATAGEAAPPRWDDWGEAPAVPVVLGRGQELATLACWVREERCRVVAVLGAGGIGKTTLAAQLAHELAPEFAVVYWRSLRNAPPPEEWLAGALAAVSAGQATAPEGLEARLGLLLGLLRDRRCLLVLDNLETVLEPGAPGMRYRQGYEGYGEVLQRLAEGAHQGCVLLTSREQPLRVDEVAVRALRLEGVGVQASRALLARRQLVGDDAAWDALVGRYAGNPLALRVVAETIAAVFGGDIAAFLAQDVAVVGGIRDLLDAQLARLSALERAVLTALAVEREAVGFTELVADLGPGVARSKAVEAVEALLRRSLLEWGTGGTFTLQPVVLEYATAQLVEQVYREVLAGEPALLVRQPLLKAQAKDFVRRSQERLIGQPLLEQLRTGLGSAAAVEQQLLVLLATCRGRPLPEQGNGPGNAVNLLRLLRGNLRGLDLSQLTIRQAYLAEVEAQDASLAGAHLDAVALAEAFDYPTAVALSADGAYLVIGTATGEVCLWRVADRTPLLATLQGHTGLVRGVALSGDGGLVASGGFDGTVKLWEAASGRLLATLQGHSGAVWSVALSGDGWLLASGSFDGTVRLWEATPASGPPGRLLATLEGHTGSVFGVALSGDGRLLASGGFDGTVRLWEAGSGRPLATLEGHSGAVPGVALSRDGGLLASGSYDGTVRLWEATPASGSPGRPLATLEGHIGSVFAVALSGDGRFVVSGSLDGAVRLWEAASGLLLATLRGHSGGVRGVALSGDGELLASGGLDGAVRLWEATPASGSPGRLLATLQGHSGAVRGVALSADAQLVASGSWDGTVRLWEVGSGGLRTTLEEHTGGVLSVALSGDGQLAASGSYDGTVRLWEATSGRPLATLQGHSGAVRGVALSGDGGLLASGSLDGAIRLWDAAPGSGSQGRLLATLRGHSGVVWSVALSGDGRLVASGSWDGTVRLWEAGSGRALATLEEPTGGVLGVALSGDGRLVASGSYGGAVRLWEAASGRLLATLQGHSGVVNGVALSGDGRFVASGSSDRTVRLWEAGSGRLLATLEEPTGGVLGVALSGDGQLAASASEDGTIRLWVVGSGACVHTLRAERRYARMDITGLTGVTEAQRAALLALGAVEQMQAPLTPAPPARASHLPAPAPTQQPPAALTQTPPPTNLPPARTTFVGRVAELAALIRALDPAVRTGTRLLTLTGVGGSGKTRLALQVAEALLDAYRDGVWLVDLSPLPASDDADLAAVAAATLAALGLHEQPGRVPLDSLVDHLQHRRLLLVLDNCSHMVAACAALAPRLLAACPELRILATSQQALGDADETPWPVAPLGLPPRPTGALTSEEVHLLEQSDAVQLFMERARAVRPGFALSAATAAQVAAICRRLDGLPLAIELAAARLNVLPLEEILVRLDDRFRLLRRGGRGAANRHQALQATLDWSYGLLNPAEQVVLRRLAVFAGGWELAAAEAVCAGRLGGTGPIDTRTRVPRDQEDEVEADAVLELLDELQDRSLVYVHVADDIPRYGLLETVRQYGLQQLDRAGETAVVRDRHLTWCVTLAEQAAPTLLGPKQGVWLARLGREHDNLRAALQWALDRSLTTRGLRVAAGLWQFWRNRGYLSEGRHWFAALLARAADDDDASMAVRASALEGAAWLAEDEFDFAQAAALFAQSMAVRRALGQHERPVGPLINEALEARASGDYARATALLEQCLAQHRALGDHENTMDGDLGLARSPGYLFGFLALVLREQGEYMRATALLEEGLTLARGQGDSEGMANALLGLADIARDQGDAVRVQAYCQESLTIFRELGLKWAIGFALNNLALVACLDEDLPRAASLVAESEAIFRGLQSWLSLPEVLITVGRVRGAQGEMEAARAALAEALSLAWEKGPRWIVAAALEEIGVQAVRQRSIVQGVHLLAAASTLRQVMGTPVRPTDRSALENALAAARTSLGDTAFADAWATGQALPLERIVAQVLAALDERTAPATGPQQPSAP